MLGGKGNIKVADAHIQEICILAQKENGLQGYSMFKAINYRSQVVNGMNYFIKVQVDEDGSCILLRLYVPVNSTMPELIGLEEGFNLNSQIL